MLLSASCTFLLTFLYLSAYNRFFHMKPLLLLTLNTLTLAGTLVLNYLAGSGKLGEKSIGAVSAQYPSLLTPASYAFSIWIPIYLLLIAFVGYQWVGFLRKKREGLLKGTGWWFALANVANGLWVIAWTQQALGLSVLLMFLLLFSLIRLVIRLRLEVWDAPLRIIFFVWWPLCFYTGWIVLASVTNVTVYLSSLGWEGGFLSPEAWAVGMIGIAALLYLFLIYSRNMREAALVGVWGFVAIAYRQWGGQEEVVLACLLAAGILFIAAAYHGIKNKATSPYVKLKKGEW